MSDPVENPPRRATTLLACCEPYFEYLAELRSGELAVDSPELPENLLARLDAEFGELQKRCASPEAGVARRELWERVAIALAATADQVVLSSARGRAQLRELTRDRSQAPTTSAAMPKLRLWRMAETLEWKRFQQAQGAAEFLTLCKEVCFEESEAAVELAGVLYHALLLGFHWPHRERPQELQEWRARLFKKAGFEYVLEASQIFPAALAAQHAQPNGRLLRKVGQRAATWAETLWERVGLGLSEEGAAASTGRAEMLRRGVALERQSAQLLLGLPQAGKETLLAQLSAHLVPPLSPAHPESAEASHHQFWYSSRAALFFPRGDLVQSASHGEHATAWRSFLSELSGYRPGHSLDGVVLVTPSDALRPGADPEHSARRAQAIRTALLEVADAVGQDLPITWVITKGDLLPGFAECAQSLSAERREQCFGWSAENDWASPLQADDLARGLEGMVARVSELRDALALHLENASDLAWLDRVYLFPRRAGELADELLAAWRRFYSSDEVGSRFLLRGIYLTRCSADGNAAPWFSKELWDRRILTEQSLARTSKQAEEAEAARERNRRDVLHRRRVVLGIAAACAVMIALALAFWRPWAVKPITNSIGMMLLWCPPGAFEMGSPAEEKGRQADETKHRVDLTQGFYIAETEVTQGQWLSVMKGMGDKTHPWKSEGKLKEGAIDGESVAANYVGWSDAVDFCEKLTELERQAGRLPEGLIYRLPTEAEWEYACRTRSKETAFSFGDAEQELKNHAVYKDVRNGMHAHEVRSKAPNRWGLYDMHGNVWEWCLDAADYEGKRPKNSAYPHGKSDPCDSSGSVRLIRGGAWDGTPSHCRSAHRDALEPGAAEGNLGFRPVLAAKSKCQ